MTAPVISTKANTHWAALRPFSQLLFVLWIAEITGAFESAMIIVALKYLIEEFGDPALVGRMGDILGRRRVLLIVLGVGMIGSLISAIAPNFGWLLFGRVLQGMTGAILPLCIGLVRENIPQQHVPMGIGLMISGASMGTAAGLVLGGGIADSYGWQGVFMASVGFCGTALVAVRSLVPRSARGADTAGIDWFSGILFAPGIALLLYYVSMIAKKGMFDDLGLVCLAAGSALLGYWWWRSLRARVPLLDVRQFKNRNVAVANLVTALVAMSSLQITLIFSILLQAPTWTGIGIGVTALVAGLAKLPSNILSTFAGPLSGWLTGRGGGRLTMLAGGTLAAIGWILVYSSTTAWPASLRPCASFPLARPSCLPSGRRSSQKRSRPIGRARFQGCSPWFGACSRASGRCSSRPCSPPTMSGIR